MNNTIMVMSCLGEEVAIKLISLGDRFYRKYVEREILNHRQLMHPHIVAFKEVFVTSKVCTTHYLHCIPFDYSNNHIHAAFGNRYGICGWWESTNLG